MPKIKEPAKPVESKPEDIPAENLKPVEPKPEDPNAKDPKEEAPSAAEPKEAEPNAGGSEPDTPGEDNDPKDADENGGDDADGGDDDDDDDEEDGEGGKGGKRPTAPDLAGESQLGETELGAADDTIELLLQMAQDLPKHAEKYGVPMYAELTPFANLRNSPLAGSSLRRDYIDQIYDSLLPIYNRAKFILNSVQYASSVSGSEQLFVSPTGKSIAQIRSEMLALMQQVRVIDNKLRSDPEAEIGESEMPAMPDPKDLPAQLASGSKARLTPPLGFEFVPGELVQRSLEAHEHFAKLEVGREHRDFKRLCLEYCAAVHNDICDTYVDVYGFIDDLMDGFREMNRDSDTWEDVMATLKDDLSRKQSVLENRLAKRESDFANIKDKAKSIPKLRPSPSKSITGDEQFESATETLEVLAGKNGLNYELRRGDNPGSLIRFWVNMEPALEKLDTTIKLLPKNAKLSDYYSADKTKWELVNKDYRTAAANRVKLSSAASV